MPEAKKINTDPNPVPPGEAPQKPSPEKEEPPSEITAGTGDKVPITKAERDQFFECMMNDTPFTKTYSLFDGRMKVLLRDRTTGEVDAITQVMLDNRPETALAMDTITMRCSIACSLVSITIDNTVVSYEETQPAGKERDEVAIMEKRTVAINALSRSKYAALCRILAQFDALLSQLTDEAASPSFFSGPRGGTGV